MLRTLGRATRVLELFTTDAPEWGATAVAHELRIAKSQAHELLFSLADGGLLQRVGAGRYRLGWRIVALNLVLIETSDLLRLAAPELRALEARFGETVHVAVWDRRPVCIDARLGRLRTALPPFRGGRICPRTPRHSARSCSPAGLATRSNGSWAARSSQRGTSGRR